MEKPKYYIKTFYEPREGFYYNQPVARLAGKSYFEYEEGSYERKNWGEISKDSDKFNNSLEYSLFNSDLWEDEATKIKAFNKVHSFVKNGKSGSGSSVTALFPFEIFLMNNGFEMISFTELSALNPGVTILCDRIIGDEIKPKTINYSRTYVKEDNFIYLGFGIEFNKIKTNFYFQTSKSQDYFQVDNSIENFNNAVNGKLKKINEKDLI